MSTVRNKYTPWLANLSTALYQNMPKRSNGFMRFYVVLVRARLKISTARIIAIRPVRHWNDACPSGLSHVD